MRLRYAIVAIVLLSGCGENPIPHSRDQEPLRLSPAQQLATMEVDGEIPTEALVVEAESLLRELTQGCEEDAAEIVAVIGNAKSQILASGRRESAIGIGRVILATSTSFKERDCARVGAVLTYTMTH